MSRASYWSHGKLSVWVMERFTDIKRPSSATMKEWREWERDYSTRFPYIYWFTETFLHKAQDFVYAPMDRLNDFRYWGYNMFVSKPHLINTQLQKGKYHEIDTRMLHGMFEMLVDFIEVEKAWMHVVWSDEERKKYELPWYKRVPYFLRWKEWRCPEAGLAHLDWEMSLVYEGEGMTDEEKADCPDLHTPTPQAISAKEQYDLYHWWKVIRPSRPDPMDASGWSAYCDKLKDRVGDMWMWGDETEGESTEASTSASLMDRIETSYANEDEEMLIRLIKVRHALWT